MNQIRVRRPSLAKQALSGHGAIGLLASAALYIVALSGMIVVVAERWQRWEQPNVAEYETLSPAAVQNAMVQALALEKGKPRTTHLYLRMPDADLPRAVVTTDHSAWYVDAAGRPTVREANGWSEFLLALHINLTLPVQWGMLLVGALGAVLAAVSVTGVLALPKIFKDAFRLRMRGDPQIARADWHNRLGTLTLPFALMIALTGAAIGLSSAGIALLAQTDKGGDREAVSASIFGNEPAHDPAPAPLANAGRAVVSVQARFAQARPVYVIVHDPATRGQFVQVLAEHPRRLIYGESYGFSGAGDYLGKVGLSDGATGRQAAASTYGLHFGNYAGLPMQLAYAAMGLALCVLTATGTTLWLNKRRRKGLPTARLAAAWNLVVWGTPLALVLAAWERWLLGPDAPLTALFWLTLAAGLGAAIARPSLMDGPLMRIVLACALAATALLHLAIFRAGQWPVSALDGCLLLGAFALWLPGRCGRAGAGRPSAVRTGEPAAG
ncbi:PepSY domain-containing protein [Novosphingobium flavum]|uniref:PepSY domain-containing protein n=1 Tax=Novosphingobium flavum TaxID=1778672 RepID=A0A7X1KLC5_9SPHN|nr:PepSY domain-containing protein [Novosphingobium flavum]